MPDNNSCCKIFSCKCFWKVVYDHWFTRGPKTYSYITGIVGFVLTVGAFQFVLANWHVMIHEGDRDNCYYNDFCYRVSPHGHDIPYNLMISNLVYILHGLILAVSVCCMEANHLAINEELKGEFSFSIGYAFVWALIFEGGFSLIYHLCPSQMTFQFDTAFMFVIAGFTVILLFNGIKKMTHSPENAKGPVGAANFFLYFLVPLFIFNYFGALHHFEMHDTENGMSKSFEIPLFICMVLWWVFVAIWVGYKLSPTLCSGNQSCSEKFCHFGRMCFALCVAAPILIFVGTRNLPETFLYSCIVESFVAIVAPILAKTYNNGGISLRDVRNNCCNNVLSGFLYVVGLVVLWGVALYFFTSKPTTNKVESPEISRDLNEECEYMGFFEYHDMWHILSSHALLMGAYLVMFISYQPPSEEETHPLLPRQMRADSLYQSSSARSENMGAGRHFANGERRSREPRGTRAQAREAKI